MSVYDAQKFSRMRSGTNDRCKHEHFQNFSVCSNRIGLRRCVIHFSFEFDVQLCAFQCLIKNYLLTYAAQSQAIGVCQRLSPCVIL